ncbi:MAG: outer membrane beta-barrel protein [Bacteroidales bacterium]|nr:outer membrane beta-barrel protein [Bacteroidales bacterium]
MKKINQIILKTIAITIFAIIPVIFYGQGTEEKAETTKSSSFSPYFYVAGHIGAGYFNGDLAEYGFQPDFSYTRFGADLGVGYQFSSVLGLKATYFGGWLAGEKEKHNAYMDSDLGDISLNATFNFSNLFAGYKDRKVSIHGLVGFGQAHYKSKVYDLTTDALLHNVTYTNYPGPAGKGFNDRRIIWIVPVGVGFDYAINEKFDFNLDYTLKFCDTDLMDGFNGGAEFVKQDMYSFIGLGLTYKFGQGNIKSMAKKFDEVSIDATPKVLEEHGDKIKVTIKGNVPEKYFSKKAAMCLTPVLKYDGGETVLPSFTLKGEDVSGDGGTFINNKTGGSFTYSTEFDYTPEMNNSELVIKPIIYKAEDIVYSNPEEVKASATFIEIGERKIADGVIYTSERIFDNEIMIVAFHSYEKETIITEKAALFFQVNRFNLNWRVQMNKAPESKEALTNLIDFTSKGWVIKDVELNGWASPEGEETFNKGLSENRSKTAYKYMTRKIKQLVKAKDSKLNINNVEEDVTFSLNHFGPDWNGFLNAVKASNIEDKNIILNVVKSAATPDKKEQEIRNMIVIYPEIEETILPPLRRSDILVNCYQPKLTDQEIANYAISDPSQLDVKELMYAATLTNDAKTKLAIYKNVISLSPKCWSAYNNSGMVNLELGNYDKASKLFAKANELSENNGKVYNNLGVLACMLDDYQTASEHFTKAKSLGENVDYNLGVIEIENGNYDEALVLFGNTKCDYNVALAQMMTGEIEAAEKTLKCTKENTAETYYLLAIIGSRTANTSMLYEYLMKAIEKDAALKTQAKDDKEFINYVKEADFIAIIK